LTAELGESVETLFLNFPPRTLVLEEDGKGTVVRLSGSLDLALSERLQRFFPQLISQQRGWSRIVVDLEGVNYISSTGVGALTDALVKAKKRDIGFVLRNMQPKVRSVFELLGLLKFFDEERADG
jgi:anti-sigma B factor antagonist